MASSSASAPSQPKGWATAEAWAKHRAIIRTLYLDQRKSLKEVKQIMEVDHDFHATEKMYKYHFNKWGLQKNVKHRQSSEQSRRAAAGKSMKPFVHEWKLNKGGDEATSVLASSRSLMVSATRGSGTILRVPTRTPSPAPRIPMRLDVPDILRLPEECLHIIQEYTRGFHDSPLIKDRDAAPPLLLQWPTHMARAATTIRLGSIHHGFRLISVCFQEYRDLMLIHNPLFVIYTFLALYGLLSTGAGLTTSLLNYAVEMSRVLLGPRHPLHLLFIKLRQVDRETMGSNFATFTQACMHGALLSDEYGVELMRLTFAGKMVYHTRIDVDTRLRVLHSSLGTVLGGAGFRRDAYTEIFGNAWMAVCKGAHAQARSTLQMLIDSKVEVAPHTMMDTYGLLRFIAVEQGNYNEAVDWAYLEVKHAQIGHNPRTIARRLVDLMGVLRYTGRDDEAEKSQAQFDDLSVAFENLQMTNTRFVGVHA
ncbi:Clr5 domain-containing protein [Xylariaceae sp. FL0016]|nr:Clr5 domain-containing protein [Xylariaceae sp. FL0016]